MIEVINGKKIYENKQNGINDVSFQIDDGEFVFIVGTSGSGKSTLMRAIMKEVDLTSGNIIVDNYDLSKIKRREIPHLRRKMGVIFQDFRLLPNKTVYENVAFAMEVLECNRREIRRMVPSVLAMVGLHKKFRCYPNQLSGGEQQRVAFARAIVNKPPIVIADEPTGNLDPDNSWEIMSLFDDLNKRGTTVIVATHAKEIVDKMKKRVITLEKGNLISDISEGGYRDEIYEY